MASNVYKVVCAIVIILQLTTRHLIYVHGSVGGYCRLENRTVVFNICKTPLRHLLPVCVGFCPSSTRWEFNSNRFVPRTSACTVTHNKTEQYVCPDSTHTAIQIIIPLACSCDMHYCRNIHPHHPL